MSDIVKVWGINGLEMEIEPAWVNPLLSTGAITLEPPATEESPTKPVEAEIEKKPGKSGKNGK